MWKFRGTKRPAFALAPEAGQESVWDYPRPPALAGLSGRVEVWAGEDRIADSIRCMRVLETASPPTVYIPQDDIDMDLLVKSPGASFCEWKGAAQYWALASSPHTQPIGWSYPEPTPAFVAIRNWLCFYPGRVRCAIDSERVRPLAGGFYGGWITDNIVGPFKGEPGTTHW